VMSWKCKIRRASEHLIGVAGNGRGNA
jgi:hypothetical protein